jgi:indole-3-glycerol phosphate synthase
MAINPKIIGVNSRNLKSLEVDSKIFQELIPQIPKDISRVAESGIATRADVELAEQAGANVILVGEALVKSGDPVRSLAQLIGK